MLSVLRVVFYTAKIQNWKQFTTAWKILIVFSSLCFTLQRYKIESNSQHIFDDDKQHIGCVLHCKDTKLKAIHNHRYANNNWLRVVFYTAKIQNWKQFTTDYGIWNLWWRCVLHCKDTKLKAIHNQILSLSLLLLVVFYTAKIQNWKQFTTY